VIGGFQVGAFQPFPAYQQAVTVQKGGHGRWQKPKYKFYRNEPLLETLADVYRLIEEERVAEEKEVIARQEKRKEDLRAAQKEAENSARLAREMANYIRSQLPNSPPMPKVQKVDTAKFWAFANELEAMIRRRQQQMIDEDDEDLMDILGRIQ